MKELARIFETYLMVLVHPFQIHHQFRHNVTLPGHQERYAPLKLAEALGVSWLFAIFRGMGKILLINIFLYSFFNTQIESFPFVRDFIVSSGISTYSLLIFWASIDIIFFPVATLVMVEIWNWVIRLYAGWLNPELPREEIADQITTHSLSANLIFMIPIIGDIFQRFVFLFLLYAGLRANLGASKSLAIVILLTPTLIGFAVLMLLALFLFCLVSLI